MIAIRDEIRRVETGEWTHDESPLAAAPHPAEDVVAGDWDHAYSRETAAFPLGGRARRQVLAAGQPDRRRVRRPQRRVLVRADRGLCGPVGTSLTTRDAGPHPGVVEHRLLRRARASTPAAPPAEIDNRYRELAKSLHPDRNADPADQERFKQVSAAYSALKDPAPARPTTSSGPGWPRGASTPRRRRPRRRRPARRRPPGAAPDAPDPPADAGLAAGDPGRAC